MSENYGGYLEGGDEVFEPERANQKFITQDSGATLAGLTTYAGMLVFCTSTGGGFTAGRLYQRNVANSVWVEIANLTATQTFTNKSIDGSTNTITALPVTAFLDGAITTAKLANAITAFGRAVLNTNGISITSTSYVDVSSMSITITATGNRAGLIAKFSSFVQNTTDNTTNTIAITDGADVVKSENVMVTESSPDGYTRSFPVLSAEGAPGAGSLTRKVRAKVSAGTMTIGSGGTDMDNDLQFMVEEIL